MLINISVVIIKYFDYYFFYQEKNINLDGSLYMISSTLFPHLKIWRQNQK